MIENSTCQLKNIRVLGYTEPAIRAQNANLKISHCQIYGATAARSGGYGLWVISPSQPALHISNSENCLISIKNSLLASPSKIDHASADGCALTIKQCHNLQLDIMHSTIQGAHGGLYRSRGYIYKPAGSGLLIEDCEKVSFNLIQSNFQGGKGNNAVSTGTSSYIHYLEAFPGAPAAIIKNSTVDCTYGNFLGGTGGDGGDLDVWDLTTLTKTGEVIHFDGAPGGPGLVLENHSHLTLHNTTLQGGPGGDPNGPMGAKYLCDESSSLTIFNQTGIGEWFLY